MQTDLQPKTSQLNTVEREPLRWLFTAEFEDGSVIEQDLDDKCYTRTDGSGSTFTDVLTYAKQKKLVAFHLYHVNGKEAASVDLQTGAFIVNNTPLHIHDQNLDPSQFSLKLIYFRETKVDNDVRATVEKDGTVSTQEMVNQRHYVNRYFIGWQTTVAGKNVQATLAVG